FFSSRRRHTRLQGDWSSDVCSSDLSAIVGGGEIFTRSPFSNDCCVSFAVSGSTAKHLIEGCNPFAAVLTPANKPPPLQGVSRERSEERRVGKGCRPGWAA